MSDENPQVEEMVQWVELAFKLEHVKMTFDDMKVDHDNNIARMPDEYILDAIACHALDVFGKDPEVFVKQGSEAFNVDPDEFRDFFLHVSPFTGDTAAARYIETVESFPIETCLQAFYVHVRNMCASHELGWIAVVENYKTRYGLGATTDHTVEALEERHDLYNTLYGPNVGVTSLPPRGEPVAADDEEGGEE